MIIKTMMLSLMLFFSSIAPSTSEECFTAPQVKTLIETTGPAEGVNLKVHKYYNETDSKEFNQALEETFGQTNPLNYSTISVSVLSTPTGYVMLVGFYNEKGCMLSRLIVRDEMVKTLEQKLQNKNVRIE